MSKPVPIDSDDLETLLLAAETTAKIQSLVDAVRQDVVFERCRHDFRAATDRVRKARANAIRENPDPIYDQPVTESECAMLTKIDESPNARMEVDATDGTILTLRRKRMVVLGQPNLIVRWGDGTQEAVPGSRQLVRLTERGAEAINRTRLYFPSTEST